MAHSGKDATDRTAAQELSDLARAHPALWQRVRAELAALTQQATPERLARELTAARQGAARLRPDRDEARLRLLALERFCADFASPALLPARRQPWLTSLWVRVALLPTALAEPPRSHALLRNLWRLAPAQGAAALALHQAGLYGVWSRELIAALAARIGQRRCLEIGAGRGLLARHLAREGIAIQATDDFSWSDRIPIGSHVLRMAGQTALAAHRPQVVLCSWPVPGNDFEPQIFSSPSVELYILITSRHAHAAGNPKAYAAAVDQQGFRCSEAPGISALLLPAAADSAVFFFQRRNSKQSEQNSKPERFPGNPGKRSMNRHAPRKISPSNQPIG